MVHYDVDEIPESIRCAKCGKEAKEVENSYQQTKHFVLITYKCPFCGNVEKRQCGKPVELID